MLKLGIILLMFASIGFFAYQLIPFLLRNYAQVQKKRMERVVKKSNQMFIFTPDESVLYEVLETRPKHIRFLAYTGVRLFWDIIQLEEKRLKVQRDELRTIIDGIKDGIVVLDRNFNILQVNNPFIEKMKLGKEKIVG